MTPPQDIIDATSRAQFDLSSYGSAQALGLDPTGNESSQLIVGDEGHNVIDGKGDADKMWGSLTMPVTG